MLNVDENKFRKWLKLTQQQYDIVKVIYRLRNRGVKTTPKNIQKEYKGEHNKYLMKPNLFNLLRTLQGKKIITRVAQAEYSIDQKGIKVVMEEAKKELKKEMDDFEKTHDHVEQFLREITYRKEQPDIHYLEGKELFEAMADALDKSGIFHVVADFPKLAYTQEMIHTLEGEPYAEVLWRKLKDKKTRINILTDLNIDTLFNHAFRAYGDPKTAYRECKTSIDRLQTQTETYKNLDIRHIDAPHGLDVAIVQQKEPVEFIVFTRDEHNDIQGGIRIKSYKTASNALKTFQRSYDYATPLNTPTGQKTLEKARENLKQKYGILGE